MVLALSTQEPFTQFGYASILSCGCDTEFYGLHSTGLYGRSDKTKSKKQGSTYSFSEEPVQHDRNRHSSAVHVLVADNSPFHTQLLVAALSREEDFRVFSSNLDAASVVAASIAHKIDVFVLNAFADEDAERGFRVLGELREQDANTRAVILLDSSKLESVLDAFRAGARGVFDHRETPDALCECIRLVHQGQVWINKDQISVVLESLSSAPKVKAVNAKGISLLSSREAEVVRCVVEGLTNREIADRLGLSQHTIKNHLFRIFDKLGVSNRIELLFATLNQNSAAAHPGYPDVLAAGSGATDPASRMACEKAAEHGILAAQLTLAQNAWAGQNGDHDAVRAYLWYSVALDQLTRSKNSIKKALNPADLAEAERQVRERLATAQQTERAMAAQGAMAFKHCVMA